MRRSRHSKDGHSWRKSIRKSLPKWFNQAVSFKDGKGVLENVAEKSGFVLNGLSMQELVQVNQEVMVSDIDLFVMKESHPEIGDAGITVAGKRLGEQCLVNGTVKVDRRALIPKRKYEWTLEDVNMFYVRPRLGANANKKLENVFAEDLRTDKMLVFVSYEYQSRPFSVMLELLQRWCEPLPLDRLVFWIDVFCCDMTRFGRQNPSERIKLKSVVSQCDKFFICALTMHWFRPVNLQLMDAFTSSEGRSDKDVQILIPVQVRQELVDFLEMDYAVEEFVDGILSPLSNCYTTGNTPSQGVSPPESHKTRTTLVRSLNRTIMKEVEMHVKSMSGSILRVDQLHQFASFLQNAGQLMEAASEYQVGASYLQKALSIYRDFGEDCQDEIAYTLNVLGLLHNTSSDYVLALKEFQEALQIYTSLRLHEEISVVLNNMALVFDSRGEYEQALTLYQRSLDIALAHGLSVANTYNNIGEIHRNMGRLEEALEMYKKSSELDLEEFGTEMNASVAQTYNNMGLVHAELGNFEEARRLYMKCKEIYEATLPVRAHADMESLLCNLGDLHETLGEYDKALEFYQEALNMAYDINDGDETAVTVGYDLRYVGDIYCEQGKYDEAVQLYFQSIKVVGKHFSEKEDIFINNTYVAIGWALKEKVIHDMHTWNSLTLQPEQEKLLRQALAYNELAMKRFQDIVAKKNDDERSIANVMENIAELNALLNIDLTKAREMTDQVVIIYGKFYKPGHRFNAYTYQVNALIAFRQGDKQGALTEQAQAIDLYLQHYREDHPRVVRAKARLEWIRKMLRDK